MDLSLFRTIGNHRIPCKYCGWTLYELVKQKNAAGAWQYRYQCQNCEWLVPKYVSKKAVIAAGLDPDEVPIDKEREDCEVCGNNGAELHHWAPYAIFGIEADRWPQSYLCQPCHSRWHNMVTPDINKKKQTP